MDFLDHLKDISSKDQNLDWANLCYYWEENDQLGQIPDGKERIVFLGDSITEEWGKVFPDFFQPAHSNANGPHRFAWRARPGYELGSCLSPLGKPCVCSGRRTR